jgi:hypothetical protein
LLGLLSLIIYFAQTFFWLSASYSHYESPKGIRIIICKPLVLMGL